MKSFSEIINLILDNLLAVCHALGFALLNNLHIEWIELFLFSTEDETLLAHRGSYKTTCLSIAIALLMLFFPKKNIIFMRKTDTDVTEIIKQVAKILKTDQFKVFSKWLWDVELKITSENASSITTNLFQTTRGTQQLLGIGSGASITGKHADIVITDDIVNKDDRSSRAERERVKNVYMELQNIKNRGGRIINTGTPWHKDDAIGLMPNVRKYDCYSTGLIDRLTLESLRCSMTNSLFAANYELRHVASDDVLFTEPKFINEVELIHHSICHVDASYGGDDGTAFTIMKKQPNGRYVAYGKRWDKHVDKCMTEIIALRQKYLAGTLYCENNADKGYLAKEFIKLDIPAQSYHESTNKYVKISTHLKGVWHLIDWLEETDKSYLNEILDYNEQAEHDDSPDSAASIARFLGVRRIGTAKMK